MQPVLVSVLRFIHVSLSRPSGLHLAMWVKCLTVRLKMVESLLEILGSSRMIYVFNVMSMVIVIKSK